MDDDPLTIEEQEKYSMDNCLAQRNKIAVSFSKRFNKTNSKETLLGGAAGALVIGLIFGGMYGQTTARVPVRNENGRIIEYKYDGKRMAKGFLETIAYTMLAALALSGIKILADTKRNRKDAEKMATDTIKQYFKKPLEINEDIPTLRTMRAVALILSNMPLTEVAHLRALASSGLTRDKNGDYFIKPENIAAASQIISNFIDYNTEIGYNVLRIMRGDQPTAYFLASFKEQKTR